MCIQYNTDTQCITCMCLYLLRNTIKITTNANMINTSYFSNVVDVVYGGEWRKRYFALLKMTEQTQIFQDKYLHNTKQTSNSSSKLMGLLAFYPAALHSIYLGVLIRVIRTIRSITEVITFIAGGPCRPPETTFHNKHVRDCRFGIKGDI